MSRVKKQLHEWDENLKDDSLPTNAVGQPLFSVLQMDCSHVHTYVFLFVFCFFFCFHSFLPSFHPPLSLLSGFCQTSPTGWRPACP